MKRVIPTNGVRALCALLPFCLSVSACELRDRAPDDHFFIESKKAILPVWVMRNKESDTFIIHNHGGQGTSYYKTYYDAYQELREHHNIVFYSQRGVESSQGNPPDSSFNWDQFVKDLDLVVRTVEKRYRPESVFIQSYSWSAYLVKRYLSDTALQGKISGYIDMSGIGHDGKAHYVMMKDKISEDADDPEIAEWIADHPEPTLDNYLYLATYAADEMTPDFIWENWEDQMSETALHYGACSPVDMFSWAVNSSPGMRASKKWRQMNEAIFEEAIDVSKIHIPTLILSGKYDYDCNAVVGADFYESISTPSDQKEHIIFKNSGHNLDLDEPDRFAKVVSDFVDRYR